MLNPKCDSYKNKYDCLERILNKTSLTTKRITHENIVGKYNF